MTAAADGYFDRRDRVPISVTRLRKFVGLYLTESEFDWKQMLQCLYSIVVVLYRKGVYNYGNNKRKKVQVREIV